MLELRSVEWRNFMSYGDYDNYLDLDTLGQCLITGEVLGTTKEVYDGSGVGKMKKSNGAGKSTVPNVILWTLFGRTMHSASPGDKVVNYFTGKDCRCKLTFKSGDYIIRTRNTAGHNELIYVKDGDETNVTSDTLSTSKNQQLELNRVFGLDWDLLCGSMFFNQYSKPWMEMADTTRKKAIERALHVDRFEYRSKVAKGKFDKLETEVARMRTNIANLIKQRDNLLEEEGRITRALESFMENKAERRKQILMQAVESKNTRDAIKRPDLDKLQAKWDVIRKVKERIDSMQDEVNGLSRKLGGLEGAATTNRQKIKLWESKAGKMCGACEQSVPTEHTSSRIEPIKEELAATEAEISIHTNKSADLVAKINQAKKLVLDKSPSTTMTDARDLHRRWDNYDKETSRLKEQAANIEQEQNPHHESLAQIAKKKERITEDITKMEAEIDRIDYLSKHYLYIYKAWSDRTKIKSFVFQEHIPYINERLKYYLDVFGLDVQIELTNALGIKSSMWGYDFESGGERKRTDVAFMLAMFDFHEQMYGRQSNVLVMDEVDGRLDDDGIDSLINIIKCDIAARVETVMIISHRDMMCDIFENELIIKRTGSDDFRGFSQIEMAQGSTLQNVRSTTPA